MRGTRNQQQSLRLERFPQAKSPILKNFFRTEIVNLFQDLRWLTCNSPLDFQGSTPVAGLITMP